MCVIRVVRLCTARLPWPLGVPTEKAAWWRWEADGDVVGDTRGPEEKPAKVETQGRQNKRGGRSSTEIKQLIEDAALKGCVGPSSPRRGRQVAVRTGAEEQLRFPQPRGGVELPSV